MSITHETVRRVAATIYERSLKKVPEDTKEALKKALCTETCQTGKETLGLMLKNAEAAEKTDWLLCSDSGVPVYFIKIGTKARIETDLKEAVALGFADLVNTIEPPILPHITNPLTLERTHSGKDVPIISFDVQPDADYIELTCSPKGLGSGRWANLKIFSFPSIETIESYIIDCVINAGSQPCPPVIIGVGIGGTFDYAAKMAKDAMLEPIGKENPDPFLLDLEKKLLTAINKLGIGPMGTGGDITALSIRIKYASGHGFVPVAVCFNCWPNRRLSARVYNNGHIEYFE